MCVFFICLFNFLDKRNCKIAAVNESSSTTKPITARSVRAVDKKIPLNNVANVQSLKMCNDTKKTNTEMAATLGVKSPSIVILDEKESIFSLVPDNLSDDDDFDIQCISRKQHSLKINPTSAENTNNGGVEKNDVDVGMKKANSNFRCSQVGRVLDLAKSESKNEAVRKQRKESDQIQMGNVEKSALFDHWQNRKTTRASKKNTFPEG